MATGDPDPRPISIGEKWMCRASELEIEKQILVESLANTHALIDGQYAEIQRLQDVLRGYEKWEGDLILNGEWGGGRDGLPAMTYQQFDELMRLQSLRNEVLGR